MIRTKELAELEPKTRAALARLAASTPVTDRWSELVTAVSVGGATSAAPGVGDGDATADGALDGEDEPGTLVEVDRRRRLRLLAAVAAALVVLAGALVVLDRARPSSRPNTPGANDPRFPKEPAHLLPVGDPSTIRVHDVGYRPSISRRFLDDAGSQLFWTASPTALPDVVRIAPDGSTVSDATIAGVDVTIVTDAPTAPGAPATERAGWSRGGLFYAAAKIFGETHLVDLLPSLVAGTPERPPSPPAGFYAPALLDNLMGGTVVETGDSTVNEVVLWPIDHPLSAAGLDEFVTTARQHGGAGFGGGGTTEHLAVHGRDALFVAPDAADRGSATLVFSPVDGTMAMISANDTGPSPKVALVTIAEGLHAVDDATWDAARYGGRLLLAGTTDGTPWSIAVHGDSCAVVLPMLNLGSGRSCTAVAPDAVATELLQNRLVAVIAPGSATRLDVAGSIAPGATIEPGARRTFSKGGTDYALWIVAPPAGVKQIEVVARDAVGQPVGERRAVTIDTH